jgi:5-methylcytosine-specific restriction endonuclease McrA
MSLDDIRDAIRERDGFRCTQCGLSQEEHIVRHGRKLDIHRKTPGTYAIEDRCVSLCIPCHSRIPNRKKMGHRTVSLPVAFEAPLKELARRLGVAVPYVIRDAIRERLQTHDCWPWPPPPPADATSEES